MRRGLIVSYVQNMMLHDFVFCLSLIPQNNSLRKIFFHSRSSRNLLGTQTSNLNHVISFFHCIVWPKIFLFPPTKRRCHCSSVFCLVYFRLSSCLGFICKWLQNVYFEPKPLKTPNLLTFLPSFPSFILFFPLSLLRFHSSSFPFLSSSVLNMEHMPCSRHCDRYFTRMVLLS